MIVRGQDERRAALRAALEALSLPPGADLEGALNSLQLACYMAEVNELPRMNSSRKKDGTAAELKKFQRLAATLRAHLNAMSREALNSLGHTDERHALRVDADLERMVSRAASAVTAAAPQPASTSPKRLAPEQIAQTCAQLYEGLTGKSAKLHGQFDQNRKGGPYFRFVEGVLAACGIEASAEYYAKRAAGHEGAIGGNGGVLIEHTREKSG
jgi:hypothetical protein